VTRIRAQTIGDKERPKERSDSMTDVSEVLEWHGRTVVGTDGDKLGKIEQIYFDQETNRPEWALIDTGMFAGKSSFMPLQGATSDGEQVTAAYSKDQVKAAPQIKPTRTISQAEEAELYRHYGVEYGESRSGSGLPERSPTGANGEPGITEGQGRLKKHLVSERVTGVMPSERDNVVVEPESTATDDTPDRRQ
jgi:sporulation protein YlmC with PRC-barrel domain